MRKTDDYYYQVGSLLEQGIPNNEVKRMIEKINKEMNKPCKLLDNQYRQLLLSTHDIMQKEERL